MPQHPLYFRSTREIRTSAENLKNLANTNADFDLIKIAADNFMLGYEEWIPNYIIDDLYRGREWGGALPICASELLAPPAETIKQFNRLNGPGESLLYLSEHPQTVFNELAANLNDEFVVLRLKKRDEQGIFRISSLGRLPDKKEASTSKRENELLEKLGGTSNYKKLLSMRRHIERYFKRRVLMPRDAGHYMVTTALSQRHFNHPEVQGVMYPSVATRYSTWNLAIKPDEAEKSYIPHSVMLCKVKACGWDHHEVDTLKTGWIDQDLNIVWDDSIDFYAPMMPGDTAIETPIST